MKAEEATQHFYISGPHSDYFLLMDEQSDHIFSTRLAAHIREAAGRCSAAADPASGLLEIWIDEDSRQVWYLFDGCDDDRYDTKGRS